MNSSLSFITIQQPLSTLKDEVSIKSEVWSFGILLWEIMTLSREIPYSDLTDPQVIDNSLLQRGGTGPGTAYPLKPLKCPPETYDLMTSCWRADPAERPTFKEIYAFLSHKIAGYEPHRWPVDNCCRPHLKLSLNTSAHPDIHYCCLFVKLILEFPCVVFVHFQKNDA